MAKQWTTDRQNADAVIDYWARRAREASREHERAQRCTCAHPRPDRVYGGFRACRACDKLTGERVPRWRLA